MSEWIPLGDKPTPGLELIKRKVRRAVMKSYRRQKHSGGRPLTIAGHRLTCVSCGKHYATTIYQYRWQDEGCRRAVCTQCADRLLLENMSTRFVTGHPPTTPIVVIPAVCPPKAEEEQINEGSEVNE